MNKGQFIPALLGLCFLAMVFKMPAADVSALMFRILTDLENGNLLGYVLALGGFTGWAFHAKWQRRTIHEEMGRISAERNELQARSTTADIESSHSRRLLPKPEGDNQ